MTRTFVCVEKRASQEPRVVLLSDDATTVWFFGKRFDNRLNSEDGSFSFMMPAGEPPVCFNGNGGWWGPVALREVIDSD